MKTINILLVDDTKTVLMAQRIMLDSWGYNVTCATNGMEALESLKKMRPDIILLDIEMPLLNGIEVCSRIKNDDSLKDIPVIMVTTKGNAESMEEAFMAGCDDYLTKPVDKLRLLAKLKTLCPSKL
jgi:CheY-like chemotaxis protein